MKYEERLAVIYEPASYKKGVLLPITMTLISYNALTGKFYIKNNEDYEGYTNKDFSLIKGNINFIHGHSTKVYIDRFMTKDCFIYIFNNHDIRNMKETLGVDMFETYVYIAEHIFKTALLPFEEKMLTTTYKSMLGTPEFQKARSAVSNEEEVYRQLYGEAMPSEEIEEKVAVYKKDSETGELKEVNSNDLFAALPETVKEELTTQVEKEKTYDDIDVVSIINQINKKIIGQEKTVKTLVSNIYYNQRLINELEENGDYDASELDSRIINILVDGSTGTGKTAIAKLIAAKLNLPIVVTNANAFSETGYVGPTITDILKKLIKQTDGDVKKAERGIIVLDEIDKIAAEQGHGHNMKKGVQEELLSFIGGGKYDIKMHDQFGHAISFDTSKITFILIGAFMDIREAKIKKNETNKIGFGDADTVKREYTITAKDYIDYGLRDEFFGRIKVLSSTKTYSTDDLIDILLLSEISPLKNLEKDAKMFGYGGITYDMDLLRKIVEEAYEMGTGARALQSIFAGIHDQLLLEMITNNIADENKKIELNDKVLEEYKKAKVITY